MSRLRSLLSATLALLCFATLARADDPLLVSCAAGLKKPVEAAVAAYQKETGREVRLQFGGSATLLGQLRAGARADLLITADEGTALDARRTGVGSEFIPFVEQRAVIAVARGNPKNIRALDDLLRPDVRVALANPEAASIGKLTRTLAGDNWPALLAKAAVTKPTVTEIATDVTLGAADAAVVWDSLLGQFNRLEAVRLPAFDAAPEKAFAVVVTASNRPAAALHFARWLAAPDRGGPTFKSAGFSPVSGDAWADAPELVLYSGGVNRPAVEKILRAFSDREGVRLTTVFNGCGILCSAMQTMADAKNPKFPDAYYACDLCFVPPVAEHFPEAFLITETDIGIVVPKGNPKAVRTLADLAQPGLRVGLCNAKQSTLGYMTLGMLQASGLRDSVRKNVVVEVPTADFLINQMRAGALEAAIVYRVNALLQKDHLDFIPVNHPGAKAVQPFAVHQKSPRRQLATRLLEFLKTRRGDFESTGFIWRGDEPAIQSKDIVIPPWLKGINTLPEDALAPKP